MTNFLGFEEKKSEKMSDPCIVERDGFATMMEILYGLVVIIGINANALVCCVFLSDIRIKNVSLNADQPTLKSISINPYSAQYRTFGYKLIDCRHDSFIFRFAYFYKNWVS